jgi:hypothetical protein
MKYPTILRRMTLARAIGVGMMTMAASAHAAPPTTAELLEQIQALQAAVSALQQQVTHQTTQQQAKELPQAAVHAGAPALEAGEEPATRSDVEGLRAYVEDFMYTNDRTREYNTATSTRGLKIGGTIITTYTSTNAPTVANSVSPRGAEVNSTFDIGANLSFAGNLYKDYADGRNLDYRLAASFSKPRLAATGASNSPRQGDSVVAVTDAYLQYAFLPSNGGLENAKGQIRIGQQKVPFGLEAQVSDDLKPTVSSAQFLAGLGNINSRQIGAVISGDLFPTVDYGFNYRAPLLEYAFGVFNGNGPNAGDDNNSKDWIARAAFTLPVDFNSILRELKLGLSYYHGAKKLNSTGTGALLLVDSARSHRAGLDLYYNHNPIGVTYEFVRGEDEALVAPASLTNAGTRTVDSRGQYATLFYNFGEQFRRNLTNVGKYDDSWPTTQQIYYRWDKWQPNRAAPADDVVKHTIGYNLFFAETTKLQLGITRTQYNTAALADANDLTALFQFGF